MKMPAMTLACLVTAALAAPSNPDGDFLNFPIPAEPFVLPAMTDSHESASVADLIQMYSSATGQYCVMDAEARAYAVNSKISSQPSGELRIAPEDLQSTFEHILATHGFVLELLREHEPRLITVKSLNTGARNLIKAGARFITEDQIEEAAKHPAMHFNTVIHVPGLDARQVTTSLRALFPDPNTAIILAAGASPSVVLTATGPVLREVRALLKEIQAANGRTEGAEAGGPDALPSDVGSPDGEGD